MKRQLVMCLVAVFTVTVCGAVSALPIPLVNPAFLDDGFTNEEQFIQNTGNNTPGTNLSGWGTEGLVRVFSMNLDGDDDPTTANAGQSRTWPSWVSGDGFGQVGFQQFQDPENAVYQDVGAFVEGVEYTFSVQLGPNFEFGGQEAFVQILRASDEMLLNETTFSYAVGTGDPSSIESVSYTAAAADAGSAIRVRFGTTGGSGTAVFGNPTLSDSTVPEPSTIALVAIGGVALVTVARRRK